MVRADLGGGLGGHQQPADELPGTRMLDPGLEGGVAAAGHRQRGPGTGHRHRDQQHDQQGVQDREDGGSSGQRHEARDDVLHVLDQTPRRPGPVGGTVEEAVELIVLDRRQLHRGGVRQILLGRHPLHFRLQPPCPGSRQSPQHGPYPRRGRSCPDRSARGGELLSRGPAGEEMREDPVDGDQPDGLTDAPADLGRRDQAQGIAVGPPRQLHRQRDQLGQPDHHGPQPELKEGVIVCVPAEVVAQRPAEQRLLGGRPHRLLHRLVPAPPPHATSPPAGAYGGSSSR